MSHIKHEAVRAFVKFISARERHRTAREAGRAADRPDPIIAQYRFCNVRRNDDRVTKWVHREYLDHWRGDPNLWFALVVARLFNLPNSLDVVASAVLPFKPEKMRVALKALRADGQNIFNAAYIVSTAGAKMGKVDYVLDRILAPAWEENRLLSNYIANAGELACVHDILMTLNGLASFMAAQVVADLKYADPAKWKDFHTFAASGPGSRRGLNRVLGQDKDAPMREDFFRSALLELREKTNLLLPAMQPITAQDIQNCLCEYDKYERARTGEGRPKQKYSRPDLPWKETK